MKRSTVNSKGERVVEDFDASERDWVEPKDWLSLIESRADTELQRGVSVTIGGTTYGIRTGQQALSLISGAGLRAERAERKGEKVTRKVATDKGIVSFSGPGLLAIFSATEDHHQAIMGRVEELHKLVSDGTITEEDLDKWP